MAIPRRTQRRSEEKRQRLVEAALHEFSRQGFDGASTRRIAARAGVPQSAVPYHFTTKEALWSEHEASLFELIEFSNAAT